MALDLSVAARVTGPFGLMVDDGDDDRSSDDEMGAFAIIAEFLRVCLVIVFTSAEVIFSFFPLVVEGTSIEWRGGGWRLLLRAATSFALFVGFSFSTSFASLFSLWITSVRIRPIVPNVSDCRIELRVFGFCRTALELGGAT